MALVHGPEGTATKVVLLWVVLDLRGVDVGGSFAIDLALDKLILDFLGDLENLLGSVKIVLGPAGNVPLDGTDVLLDLAEDLVDIFFLDRGFPVFEKKEK